jgi:cobalt/nickel transport system permease protein
MPRLLQLQFVMTERYIAVIAAEARSMLLAYRLRSRSPARGIRLRHAGSFLGQLLLRSFDRALRVYDAMRLRGFTGAYTGAGRAPQWAAKDTAFIALSALSVFVCRAALPLRLFEAVSARLAGAFR